jgi:predicted PurR-regulated permease PerM
VNDKLLILPLYVRMSILLVGIIAFFFVLYLLQSIIVPLVFAVIIAILINPVIRFFVRIGFNRVLAIVTTLFLSFLIIATFGVFIVSQLNLFGESWPILANKFTELLDQSINKTSGFFHIDSKLLHDWLNETQKELVNLGGNAIGKTLMTVGNTIAVLLLIPVYTFIILYYKDLLMEFIHRVFPENKQMKVRHIVKQVKMLLQKYLVGLVIESVLVAILNSTALLILGIDYAILIGILGALLNVIPYIGGVVAVALPMIVALATKSPWFAVYVMLSYSLIQLIDNNYIVPVIVSAKVKINALFSIIVVIAGNALWGIPGMFLSIPLFAIVKLIFDQITPLKPWGFLFGDSMSSLIKVKPFLKKQKRLN